MGNDLQVTKSGVEEFLPAATVMVVSVTASTTQGLVSFLWMCCKILTTFIIRQKMEQDELDLIFEACDMVNTAVIMHVHTLCVVLTTGWVAQWNQAAHTGVCGDQNVIHCS